MMRRAAFAGALLLVAVSCASYLSYAARVRPAERWEASDYDPADYRFVAEYFWGVPFVPATYDPLWAGGWGAYLRTVPFRGIGLGSLYLAIGWLRLGHAPATPSEVLTTGLVLATLEKIAFAAALLTVFAAVLRRWGAGLAFLTLAVTGFPPHFWRFFDDFLAEPVTRILFLFAFACTLAMQDCRSTGRLAFVVAALFFLAAQLKVQWYVGALLLLPVLLVQFRTTGVRWPRAALLSAAMLAIPLSVIAVNWIGWKETTLSPGIGLHANLRSNGEVLRGFSAMTAEQPSRPAFADPRRPWLRWWNLYIGAEATRADYDALDRYANRYLRSHPAAAAGAFFEGLRLASTVPGVTRINNGIVRLVPLAPPWSTVVRALDVLVWVLLLIGMAFGETRAPCGLALVLWLVPAIGNILSPYEIRYHMPMAGIGAAAAATVVVALARRMRPAERLLASETAVQ